MGVTQLLVGEYGQLAVRGQLGGSPFLLDRFFCLLIMSASPENPGKQVIKSFENELEVLSLRRGNREPLSVLSKDKMTQVVGSLEEKAGVARDPDAG